MNPQPTAGSQQVAIPGLTFLAAAQAQNQAQQPAAQAAISRSPAQEQTKAMQAAIPPKKGYQPPAKRKKMEKRQRELVAAAAATTGAAAIPLPPTPSSESDRAKSDVKTQPSAESGGVPDPTPDYVTKSLLPPTTLPASRRILVIMDLNGTLLHRPSKKRSQHFIERPHAKRFMQYCLDNFSVAIWSSARPHNVNSMVAQLLTPEQVRKCLVVWARDKFGLSASDYDAKVQVYKRLSTVWADPRVQSSHPDALNGGRWDQTNTVLVDDSIEKGRSEPHNILVLPEFAGVGFEKADVLPQVHDFLNTLCWQANISSYMRHTPFGLDAAYSLAKTQ